MQLLQRRVAVDTGEPPVLVDDLARYHDEVDGLDARSLDHRVENRGFRVEIGVGDLVPIDEDEIGSLANGETADPAAKGCRHRATEGRHAQNLTNARDIVLIHSRYAMGAQHHAHLLEHVTVVVDAGLVEADRGIDAALLEEVQRCETAAQAEIGTAIVADMSAGCGDAVEIGLVEPDAMAEGQPRPEEPETVDIVEGRATAAPAALFPLIGGLDDMPMHCPA